MKRDAEFIACVGPAATGKTTALLEIYRGALATALNERRPGTTLWLCPTNRARNEIRRRLLDDKLPATFRPNLATFDDFADQIVRSMTQPVSPISEAAQRLLIRRVVMDLKSRRELPYFGPIAQTAGFLDLVGAFISELKRAEKWPSDFDAACATRGDRRRDRELGRIYAAYQQALVAGGVYDGEGRFWSARAALESGNWAGFEQLSLVVVDGFTDFTEAQYRILELLARRADQLLISLLAETAVDRGDLFAKTSGVLERLKRLGRVTARMFPESKDAAAAANENPIPAAIEKLSRRLFTNPRQMERAAHSDGIEIVAVAGVLREVLLIASRVKKLLLEGTAPDDIVVAVRDLDAYAGMFNEVFTSAGLPLACEAGVPLARLGPFKTLLNVLTLEAEDWPFRRLMTVLDSRHFQPEWPEFAKGAAARAAAAALRSGELSDGRERSLAALERLAGPSAPRGDRPDEQAAQRQAIADIAWRLLSRLSAATADLRREHDFAGWARVIAHLIRELGLDNCTLENDAALPSRRLGETLTRILFDVVRVEAGIGLEPISLTLREFSTQLTDLLERQRQPPVISETGRIRILEAEQVRHLDVPYLFLAGLNEASFPRHRRDDCLYGEGDRQDWNRLGLGLSHRELRAQEELLMFYGVVTRARRQLVLTYPAVGDDGQPLSPSPYLAALRDVFEPDSLKVQLEEQLDPVPQPERIISPADARVFGMSEALAGRPEIFRTVCERQSAARNSLAAVDLNVRRFKTAGFTNCEGWLENPRNIEALERRFSPAHEFSASQLESYAECPFRFLVAQVLELERPVNPGVETDYGRRGTLIHDVLARLHRALCDAGSAAGGSSSPPRGEDVALLFQQQLQELLRTRPAGSQLRQALDLIEQRLLDEWGVAYGRQWDDYVAALPDDEASRIRPTRFETAFGVSGAADPAAPAEFGALVVGRGSDSVRVGGRIDRIDEGVVDGQRVFSVIDYKTGRPRLTKIDSVESGRALQLALYALAVTRLNITGDAAQLEHLGYWYVRESGFSAVLGPKRAKAGRLLPAIVPAVWKTEVETLEQVIPRLAAGMRSGRFPVVNKDQDCTATCPYHTICRVSQIRALPEEMGKEWNP